MYGSQWCFHLQWLIFLQKELADNTEHSKTCESERDHLREERTEWLKVEADLKDSVKKLEKTCAEMEQSRMDLQTQLQKLKARAV